MDASAAATSLPHSASNVRRRSALLFSVTSSWSHTRDRRSESHRHRAIRAVIVLDTNVLPN